MQSLTWAANFATGFIIPPAAGHQPVAAHRMSLAKFAAIGPGPSVIKESLSHIPFWSIFNKLPVTSNMVLSFVTVALWNRADHYIFILWLWPPYVIGADIIFLP